MPRASEPGDGARTSHARKLRLWSACLGALAALVFPPASADDSFVLGNIEFILLHELAHVLIHDLDVPIIGPEENAADYIATIVLIRADRFDDDRADRARRFVGAVANGFATEWEVGELEVNELPYWDSHGLTIQRFFQIGCLLYGSSPETLPQLPARMGMPEPRAARCRGEFEKADRSVAWLMKTYGRNEDLPAAPVTIDYQPPRSVQSQRVLTMAQDARLFETTVDRLTRRFAISRPITLRTRPCRKAQAGWDPAARVLTVCYELFDYYYLLAANPGKRRRDDMFDE